MNTVRNPTWLAFQSQQPLQMRLLQLGWLMGLLSVGGLAVVASPPLYNLFRTICPTLFCEPALAQPNSVTAAQLARFGISLTTYATVMVTLEWGYFLLWVALGVVIIWRRPGDTVGLLLAVIGLFVGGSAFLRVFSLTHPSITLPIQLQYFVGGSASAALFFSLFPDGRWVPRWTRWVVLLAVVEGVTSSFLAPQWGDEHPTLALAWMLLLWGFLFGAQIYRYRSVATHLQRLQTRWLLVGLGMFVLNLAVIIAGLGLNVGERYQLPVVAVCYLATASMALAIANAILRYRLFDIDLILNRALVYGTLTAIVSGAYVLIVSGLGVLLQGQGSLLLALIATGILAVAFQPLRDRVQRAVNRLFYGRRAEPYAVVAQLSSRLKATLAPDATLPTIAATLAEALHLPYVAISLDPRDGMKIATASSSVIGTPVAIPLHYQGDHIGQLLICPRRGEAELSLQDRQLLDDLAQQAGAAVYGVRLMDELRRLTATLQRAREQLVLAREEERRRIRSDLHDDLAPTLAGLALYAETVADLVRLHPERAQAMAHALNGQIRTVVRSIRHLAHDLRPLTLDEYGLLAAIRERVAQLSTNRSLIVTLDAPDALPALPAAVEVAAYRIVQEALMNVASHAQARNCRVTVICRSELGLVVDDDGVGMAPDVVRGVGLRSMRERAEELGGRLEISTDVGRGTSIRVCLPISSEALP
jgi:signal transduction histidine kinase